MGPLEPPVPSWEIFCLVLGEAKSLDPQQAACWTRIHGALANDAALP